MSEFVCVYLCVCVCVHVCYKPGKGSNANTCLLPSKKQEGDDDVLGGEDP